MKRFSSRLALFLILLSLVVSTRAAVFAKDSWTSVQSKNFLLIGNASQKDIKEVAIQLEQFRDAFSRLFTQMKFNSPVPTIVVVFKNDSSYRPFKLTETTAGYFQPGPDVNYITLTTEHRGEQDPFTVIFHEYTHLLVENTIEDAPPWFNEGLAEYYSTFKISNDQKIELGNPITSHVLVLRQNKLLPLRTLFEVDHKSPHYNEGNKQNIFYAQSWALMHYLMLNKNPERPTQLARFIGLINKKIPIDEAFTQAFQTTFEAMEKELRDYVRQDRYRVLVGHFERKLETDRNLQTAALTEAEAQAYLGDLLLHTNRGDAENYLTKALELDPDLAFAHASLGMLRFRQGRTDEARKSLERAVARNSQSYLIHYYYAYTLSRSRPDEIVVQGGYDPATAQKIRESLNKAIALRPDHPESYNLLAFVNLVTGHGIDETIGLLKKQIELLPGRGELKFMMAQLYLRKDDYASSRQVLEQLAQSSTDIELARRAQALLTQVVRIQESLDRFKAQNSGRSSTVTQTFNGNVTVDQGSVANDDPSADLREALRKPAAGETQLQATLIRVDCEPKGPVFVVQVGQELLRLRADRFEQVDITTFSADVSGDLSCGLRRPPNPVVVCYVATADKRSKVNGVLRSIEFVPGDFQLKPPQKP